MTLKRVGSERFSLARWSRRKLEAAVAKPAAPAAVRVPATAAAPVELPPVESLTFDSDFTPFLRPDVDPTLKRAALKRLLRDARFNVMDGLDTYIDDYTKADPIPADMLAELVERFDLAQGPEPAAPAIGAPRLAPSTAEQAPSGTASATETPASRAAAREGSSEEPGTATPPAARERTAAAPDQSASAATDLPPARDASR